MKLNYNLILILIFINNLIIMSLSIKTHNNININHENNDNKLKSNSMNLFYQKIYQNLILDPTIDEMNYNYFLSLTDQSIPVNKLLFQINDHIDNSRELVEFSKLVDVIPDTKGGAYKTPFMTNNDQSSISLSNIYLEILNNATFKYSPNQPLSPIEYKHLLNIFDNLKDKYPNGTINDSKNVKICLEYKNIKNIMNSNYNIIQQFIQSPDASYSYVINFDNSENQEFIDMKEYYSNQYETVCYQYKSDMKFIEKNTGYASIEYLDFVRGSMNGSKLVDSIYSGGESFYPTFIYPQKINEFSFEGINIFTKFVFNETNDINFPLVNQSLIGSNNNKKWEFTINNGNNQIEIDQTSMEISFEVSSIPIDRPWFIEKVMTSNNWELNSNGYYSDGNLGGISSIYISSVLIAKNINITLNTTNNEINQNAIKQILNSQNANFGPLFIKGSIDNIPMNESNPIILDDGSIINYPGYQIIGFVCTRLPMMPNFNGQQPTENPTTTPSPTVTPSINPTSTPSPNSHEHDEKSNSNSIFQFNLTFILILFISFLLLN